jgi:hypothetical protein
MCAVVGFGLMLHINLVNEMDFAVVGILPPPLAELPLISKYEVGDDRKSPKNMFGRFTMQLP